MFRVVWSTMACFCSICLSPSSVFTDFRPSQFKIFMWLMSQMEVKKSCDFTAKEFWHFPTHMPIIPKVSWIFLPWIWAYFYSEDLCLVVCMKVREINMQVTQINHLFSEGEQPLTIRIIAFTQPVFNKGYRSGILHFSYGLWYQYQFYLATERHFRK